jgi:non-specific serine/threonine protein kinase
MVEKAYEEQFEAMAVWMVKIEKEHDNLRSALAWADQHSPDEYMLLTGALAWFWWAHAYFIIGTEYLEKSLAKRKAKSPAIARVLFGLALLTGPTSGYTKGYELFNESFEIWRDLGNLKEQSIVLRELGMLEYGKNSYESGLKYCEESLELATEIGNRGLINYCALYVCQGLVILNYIDRAKPMAEQLLKLSRELNQPIGIMAGEHFLGDCALIGENFKEAEKTYAEGMKNGFQFGELFIAIQDMIGVAMSVGGQSRYAKTIRLNAAALEQASRLGIRIPEIKFWQDLMNKYIIGAKKKLTKEQLKRHEEDGKKMGFEAAIKYALDFDKD